jgi:large subunit ribosomal protein L25
MTMNATLKAEMRHDTGKGAARKLRATGRIPAVVYGQGDDATHLTLDTSEARYLFERISVENTIVNLEVEGEAAPLPTLIREIQVHPFRPDLIHVDFYKVEEGVKVEVNIPLHLEGIPAGVKNDGGTIQQIVYELPMKVIPSKIPDQITVDVTSLEIGDSLHVYDLELEEGLEAELDADRTIATVIMPKGIAEDEGEELEEAAEPELIGEDEAPEGTAEGDEAAGDETEA